MSIATEATIVQEPAEAYHANTAWNSRGMLKEFKRRRRLYQRKYILGHESEKPETAAMQRGTLCHAVLLEGKAVGDCVTVIPADVLNADGHRKGSAWTAFKRENEGKVLMTAGEAREALAIVESVISHPSVSKWHAVASLREASIYWEHCGLKLRCKPDWLIDLGDSILGIDFKTAKDASLEGMRSSIRSEYAFQQVHYTEGIEKVYDKPCTFLFVCSDSAEPYTTYVHGIETDAVRIAKADWDKQTTALSECLASGDWSDGEDEIQWHGFTEKDYLFARGW